MNLDDVLKGILKDIVIPLVIKQIVKAVPFFGLPIINPIFVFIAGLIADKMFDEMSLFLDFQRIAFRNSEFQREFDRAGVSLLILADQKGIDSDEFKKARLEYRERLFKLAHPGE